MESEEHKREATLKEASVSIDIIIHRLQNLRNNLRGKAESYFRSIVEFQARHDPRASMYADEVAQLRNLAQKLYYGEILLEKVKVRLEVISLLGPVGEQLRVAEQLISEAKVVFSGVDVDLSEVNTLSDRVSEIMESTQAPLMEYPPQVSEVRSPEVNQIISEASTLAAERIASEFPQVPAEEPVKEPAKEPAAEVEKVPTADMASLEGRLFKYLSERSGQYSPDEASKTLGINKEDLARALKGLSDKGKIVLEDFEREEGKT